MWIFPTQELNQGLLHKGGLFTNWAIREAQLVMHVTIIASGDVISPTVNFVFFLFFYTHSELDAHRVYHYNNGDGKVKNRQKV